LIIYTKYAKIEWIIHFRSLCDKGGDGVKKYNYFDDDDINAIGEVRQRVKTEDAETKHDKEEVLDAIKAFSNTGDRRFITRAREVLSKNPFEELEKASKRKKRLVSFFMFMVFMVFFVLLVFLTVHSVTKENERIAKFNTDAGTTCAQYSAQFGNTNYENLYNKYGVQGYRMTGLCYVREMDFDHDGISELLLAYNDSGVYYVEVWGYNNDGVFSVLLHEKATQTKKKTGDAWITVYAKNNKYYIGVHEEGDITSVSLLGLRGEKFESRYTASYDAKAEAFTIKGEVDAISFERIKLAVLSEQKATVITNQVTETIEGFSSSNGDESVKDAISNTSINAAFYRIVEERNQKYGAAEYVEKNGLAYVNGLADVELIDFNGDDQDELMLIYRKSVKSRTEDYNGNYVAVEEDKYYIEIYRYNGTSAVIAYKGEGISNSLDEPDDQYFILKKENGRTYYCQNAYSSREYGRIIHASSTIMKFNKVNFEPTFKASYNSEYGYGEYFIDDEEVYKSRFNEEGYQVPLFDGNEDYDASVFYITYLQRDSDNAADVKDQVAKTNETIKQLNPSYNPN